MRVVLVADGGFKAGVGHLVRSITLGRALAQAGCHVILSSKDLPTALASRIADSEISIEHRAVGQEDPLLAEVVADLGADVLVRDGYNFTTESTNALEQTSNLIVAIDDSCEAPLGSPDVVINQNLHGPTLAYRDLPDTTVLLTGPMYSLIRREVLLARQRSTPPARENFILVSMGGGDPRQLKPGILRELRSLNIGVVVAPGVASDPGSQDDFVEQLRSCRMALLSAGSQTWEAACLGTPVIAIATVANQSPIAVSAENAGFATALDWTTQADFSQLSPIIASLATNAEALSAMSENGRALIDGFGAARVAEKITQEWSRRA